MAPFGAGAAHGGDNHSVVILEFRVDDVDEDFEQLAAVLCDVVQKPTTQLRGTARRSSVTPMAISSTSSHRSALMRAGHGAGLLAPSYAPELGAEDLTRLVRHQIALRLSVNSTTSAPFTAETLPPFEDHEHAGQRELIRRISRERYGTSRVRRDAQLRAQME